MNARLFRIRTREELALRVMLASGLLSLLIGGAFAVLLVAITEMRSAATMARHTEHVLASANDLERLVIDLETGQRGYIITGDERFLQPWQVARGSFGAKAAELRRLAELREPEQRTRAARIAEAGGSYIRDYSDPLVAAARENPASAHGVVVTTEGKRRVDILRGEFDVFVDFEHKLAAEFGERSARAAQRATGAAVGGISGSVLLISVFGIYLTRSVARPVRRAAVMAGRLAEGDLTVRMPETAPAEIGLLERSFNTMAASLARSRDELRRIADEQSALRRVATLVARGVPPPAVFDAVAAAVGRILGADCTVILRYESVDRESVDRESGDRESDKHESDKRGVGDSATMVGSWGAAAKPDVGSRWSLAGGNAAEMVRRTGRAARVNGYADARGALATWAREHGIESSIGNPITVEGRLWGVMVALRGGSRPWMESAEDRIRDFTELVATAIANTESRAELAASRARVVAAGDAARRRIERDLHDGTQQRLVALGIQLRLVESSVPPGHEELRLRLSQTVRGVTGIVEELQEISRGLHPAVLSRRGLPPALRSLARRSAVPAELDARIDRTPSEQVQVAVYYVVSEALTNAAKHARASVVRIDLIADDAGVRLRIADDGVGGADPARGTGLIGLKDRVEAVGGTVRTASPPGDGTTLDVTIPA